MQPCPPALGEVELVQSVLYASSHVFYGPGPVNLDEESSSLVVLEERLCVLCIDLLAKSDGLDRVVRTRALVPSPHETLYQLLCRNFERDHSVEGEATRHSPLMG